MDGWRISREQGGQGTCSGGPKRFSSDNAKQKNSVGSVYARHLPELRKVAEPILQEVLDEDVELRWMEGTKPGKGVVVIEQLDENAVEEWSDGSRVGGRAAGATRSREWYLGEWAPVADAEEVEVALAWEEYDRVALDTQGAIQRIYNLQHDTRPRSWIEERLWAQMQERPRTLMWVKGHTGVKGNKEADKRAGREAKIGRRTQKTITTPGGG